MSIETLKNGICGITEPRRASHGNIMHRLEDIIIIALCAIICGGEDFTDIEVFGKERKEWLKDFLELPNGIPDSDIFRRIFERLNHAELLNCLSNWLEREFARAARSYWSIENRLRWPLDVIFREDAPRARKDNSPLNLNILRKLALSLLNQAGYGRMSKKTNEIKGCLKSRRPALLAVLKK